MPGRDERLRQGFFVPDVPAAGRRETLAVQRRREGRRRGRHEEGTIQERLAVTLATHLDRGCTCWMGLENKPRSRLSGLYQRRRGIKSGVSDVLVIQRQTGRRLVVFIELKSRAGLASKSQKQFRLEVLASGGEWWMARSENAAMMALCLSGVQFCRPSEPRPLQLWEGPFDDPTQKLPMHPEVRAERQATLRAWRQGQRERKAQQQLWRDRVEARKAARDVICLEPGQSHDRDGRMQ